MNGIKRFLVERGSDMALIGVSIAIITSIVTALPYTGHEGEPYQAVNHSVSELGERGVSELANVFNLGLIVGGLFIATFMLGQALVASGRMAQGFWVIGTLSALAMAAVGIFSVDLLEPHIAVAAAAFLLILVASIWFVVWVFRGGASYPRWLGWFAGWVAVSMVAFLVLPPILQPDYTFEMDFTAAQPRPGVLLNSLLEWVAILSAWAWIAALAWQHHAADPGGSDD